MIYNFKMQFRLNLHFSGLANFHNIFMSSSFDDETEALSV